MPSTPHVSPTARRAFGTIVAAVEVAATRRGQVRVVVGAHTGRRSSAVTPKSLRHRGRVVEVAISGAAVTADCARDVPRPGGP